MKQMLSKLLNKDYTRYIVWILRLVLVAILIPLFVISFYNFPFSDDLSIGSPAHEMFLSGGNLFQIIGAAIKKTYEMYFGWQGSYSVCFMTAINPSIFGETDYFIGTFLILGSFVLFELRFFTRFFKLLLFENKETQVISHVIVIMQLLFVPGIVESFYWFTGSVYYTFFFGVALLLLSLIFDRFMDQNKGKASSIIQNLLLVVLVIVLGGANYPLGLMLSVFALGYILYSLFTRKRGYLFQIFLSVLFYVCFAASIFAPGNQIRQTQIEKMGIFDSIFSSFQYGWAYGSSWIHPYILAGFLCLLPFIWKGLEKSKFSFPFPGLVLAFSAGMFSAYFTPTLYATASPGPRRLICIIYYLFYILIILNATYFLGWVKRKTKGQTFSVFIQHGMKATNLFYVVCAIIFVLSIGMEGIKNTNPVKALYELKSGQAAGFRAENLERIQRLNESETDVVILDEFTFKPSIIYLSDLEDSQNYKNISLAEYYHKKEVILSSYLKDE